MTALAFDTHATIKSLTGAGFDEAQAEAITNAVSDAVSEGVASKADIARLEDKIDGVESRLDRRIDGVENRLDGVESRLEGRIDRVAAELRADFFRALWLQGAGIVAMVAALLAISRVV